MRFGSWTALLLGLALATTQAACGGHECGPGTSVVDGACVPDSRCGPGTVLDQGACVPAAEACGSGTVLIDGQCRDPATVQPDVAEPAEPNGLEPGHTPGMVALPAAGASVTIGGCIDPGDTAAPDVDVFRFEADEPALLEVSVDGYGGLIGGFVMVAGNSAPPAVIDHDWRRYGVAVASDRATRQVFVPAAGGYGLAIADSRTLLEPTLPAGSADTCYLATITRLDVPAPQAITTTASGASAGQVAFYGYTPGEGDLVFATAAAPDTAVLVDLVALVNGQYRVSSPASRARGASASAIVGGLRAGDQVLLVVDPVIDVSAPAAPYTLDVFSPAPVALPRSGGMVTVPRFGPRDGDPVPSWAYFDAAAGDVVFLDLWTDAAQGLLISMFTADLELVSIACGPACTSWQGHVQVPRAGRYYLALIDVASGEPGWFSLGARRDHIQPAALALGTTQGDEALDERGDRFYQLELVSFAWLALSGAILGDFAGQLEIRLYERGGTGVLDDEVPAVDSLALMPGATVGRIVDRSASLLVRVSDSGFAGGAPGRFEVTFAERPYADLGTVDMSTSVERLDTALAAGERHYYLVRAAPGSVLDVAVTGELGLDPVFTEYDRVETPLSTNQTGADATEVPLVVVNESADWVAFEVSNAVNAAGAYDLTVGGRAPPTYQATAGTAIYASICPADGGAGQVHSLRGDNNPWGWPATDEGVSQTPVDLRGMGFRFYGIAVQELTVSSNGWLTFEPGYAGAAEPAHQRLPSTATPNAVIAPLWSDTENVTVCTQVASGRAVVQWTGNHVTTGARVAMQVVMDAADHRIEVIFAPEHEHTSNSATIGIEDRLGVRGTLASYDTAGNATPGTSWAFTITP